MILSSIIRIYSITILLQWNPIDRRIWISLKQLVVCVYFLEIMKFWLRRHIDIHFCCVVFNSLLFLLLLFLQLTELLLARSGQCFIITIIKCACFLAYFNIPQNMQKRTWFCSHGLFEICKQNIFFQTVLFIYYFFVGPVHNWITCLTISGEKIFYIIYNIVISILYYSS